MPPQCYRGKESPPTSLATACKQPSLCLPQCLQVLPAARGSVCYGHPSKTTPQPCSKICMHACTHARSHARTQPPIQSQLYILEKHEAEGFQGDGDSHSHPPNTTTTLFSEAVDPAPAHPNMAPNLLKAMMSLQSFLWNSVQALVLQYLLQVRIP